MSELDITAERYHDDHTGRLRAIADRLMEAHQLDPGRVMRIEITEAGAWVTMDLLPNRGTRNGLTLVRWHGCWHLDGRLTGCSCPPERYDSGIAAVYLHRWYPHPGTRQEAAH